MSDSTLLSGGCLCGNIRYQITEMPFATEYCHCGMCQKSSGAPAVTWMDFKIEQVDWLKEKPTEYQSSEFVSRGFCSNCGSTLTFRDSRHPKYFTLTINTLDDPNLVEPTRHIYTEDQMSWLKIEDEHPRFKHGPSK